MIKLVFCLRRKDGMSREEFQRYWLSKARTSRSIPRGDIEDPAVRPGAHDGRRVNDALRASRGGPETFDGVAELWWSSLDEMVAAASSEEGRAGATALLEDERTFIDLERSPLWIAEEHEIVG